MNLVKIFLFTFLFQGCLYAQISDSYLDEAEEKIKIELLVLIEETYNALETKPSEGVPQKGDLTLDELYDLSVKYISLEWGNNPESTTETNTGSMNEEICNKAEDLGFDEKITMIPELSEKTKTELNIDQLYWTGYKKKKCFGGCCIKQCLPYYKISNDGKKCLNIAEETKKSEAQPVAKQMWGMLKS